MTTPPSPHSMEPRPSLLSIESRLRGHVDFQVQVQGGGLALFATGSPRTAYMSEMLANAALLCGGPDELVRQARCALGTERAPVSLADLRAEWEEVRRRFLASEDPVPKEVAARYGELAAHLTRAACADLVMARAQVRLLCCSNMPLRVLVTTATDIGRLQLLTDFEG